MKHIQSQRGFTLIETLVLLFVFVIILGAIVSSLIFAYRGQRFALEQAEATRSARIGMESTIRALREMSTADDGAYPVISMATSSVAFYSDYDNDGRIERIRYFLDGADYKRGVTESSGTPLVYSLDDEVIKILSDNVRNNVVDVPVFTYYDQDGVVISNYAAIDTVTFIVVRVLVNIHPERAPNDFELRSSATLRNI
ncbi:hypothetical protein COB18_03480 [Candidatus Kaiserbacteria bacterium]|nr:MAG: hypothetical protein COB18_03480 [Candidatus Kaiserbacteria bacterium]